MPTAASSFLVATLLWATQAVAHRLVPQRDLVVQVDASSVAALLKVRLSGAQAALYAAMYDLDHDGKLSPAESRVVAALLLAQAWQEAAIQWDGTPVPSRRADVHLEVLPDELIAVGLFELSELTAADPSPHTLRVQSMHAALTVQVQALDAWRLAGAALAPDGRALATPVVLQAGEGLEVAARRATK